MEVGHVAVDNWVGLAVTKLLSGQFSEEVLKGLLLISLKLSQTTVKELLVLPGEGTSGTWQPSIEEEVNNTLVFRLNLPLLLSLLKAKAYSALYWILICANNLELIVTDSILETLGLGFVAQVLSHSIIHPVLEVDVKLILESVSPVILTRQELHAVFEIS